MEPLLLTVKEASEVLKVSRSRMYNLMLRGESEGTLPQEPLRSMSRAV